MVAFLLVFATILNIQVAAAKTFLSPIIPCENDWESCPSTEQRDIALQKVRGNVYQYLFNGSILPQCGEGIWYQVAYLNMADCSQQCPSAWREYNTSQFRACGRPISSGASRPSQIFPISRQYSKVCGRVIGIQVASPDAFYNGRSSGIDESYIDGVSITHGSPRHHIWSYVASISEVLTDRGSVCPCDYSGTAQSQSFVGNNYYCESGNPIRDWEHQAYPNDKLWDGEMCSNRENTCCTGTNTPPWFRVNLSSPTSRGR